MNVYGFFRTAHIIGASVFNLIKDKRILVVADYIDFTDFTSEIHEKYFDILLFKIFRGSFFVTSARSSFVNKITSIASKKHPNSKYLN